MLRYVDLEYMALLLLARGFRVIDYWSLYNGVRRDYIKLVRGVIVIELHRRWVTINPPTYIEWYRESI